MKGQLYRAHIRPAVVPMMAVLLMLTPLLAACSLGGQTIIVTATPTHPQSVVIVTATFTAQPPTATSPAAEQPTFTPYPTYTPYPTFTPLPPTATLAPSPVPPTATPVPPTKVPPKPTSAPPKPTATKAASYPPPTLLSPDPEFSCFNVHGCNFTWSWGMALADNQYFQVQLVGPGNEHRGIHPPTKSYSFQSNWSVYEIIPDWCDVNKMCHMQWTVAVIEWDGKDPSKIGRTLIEAPTRWVWL